jgi:16S rRNA processing protein RimM
MIEIGTIVNTHGLKGDLKLRSESDFKAQRFAVGAVVYMNGRPYTVASFRAQQGFDIIHFEGIDHIDQAQLLKDQVLMAPLDDALLAEGEFHVTQLIGCAVREAGELLGTVTDIRHFPAQSLLVVNDTIQIPFVDAFILEVDLTQRIIDVELIEGMR